MTSRKIAVTICLATLTWTASAQAQSPVERYIADRDAAIARFTPERVPKIEKPQMDQEERARTALDRQLFAIIGTTAPKGFGEAKSNIASLFTGDMDFGKLDGVVFEADEGNTQMIVTTLPLLQLWLKGKEGLPKDADQAIVGTRFLMSAISTDAAILHFADIPLGTPRTFAMLGGRTQDRTPDEAGEVFVAAIRGDRVFVANASLKEGIKVPACTKSREAADKKLDAQEKKELKPGVNNSALVDRLSKLRDQVDAEFLKCFAENASKDSGFAGAVARARELYDRMPE